MFGMRCHWAAYWGLLSCNLSANCFFLRTGSQEYHAINFHFHAMFSWVGRHKAKTKHTSCSFLIVSPKLRSPILPQNKRWCIILICVRIFCSVQDTFWIIPSMHTRDWTHQRNVWQCEFWLRVHLLWGLQDVGTKPESMCSSVQNAPVHFMVWL